MSNISYLTICKIAASISSLSGESPLMEVAKTEFEMALYVLETAKNESNQRDGLKGP